MAERSFQSFPVFPFLPSCLPGRGTLIGMSRQSLGRPYKQEVLLWGAATISDTKVYWPCGCFIWRSLEPVEKEMATHSSVLAWRIPWIEEPGGLPSTGSQSWTRLSDCTYLEPVKPFTFLIQKVAEPFPEHLRPWAVREVAVQRAGIECKALITVIV